MKIIQFQISSKDKEVFSFLEQTKYESASKDLIESTFIELYIVFIIFKMACKIKSKLFSESLEIL
jgi:hypothetical protein